MRIDRSQLELFASPAAWNSPPTAVPEPAEQYAGYAVESGASAAEISGIEAYEKVGQVDVAAAEYYAEEEAPHAEASEGSEATDATVAAVEYAPEELPATEAVADESGELTVEEMEPDWESMAAEVGPQAPIFAPSFETEPVDWAQKQRRSAMSYVAVALGSMIVIGGLGWSGFQLWPRGSVERSIVEALAAQPRFVERTGAANPFYGLGVEADSSPAFADLNGDGAPDLVIGSRSGDFRVYRNVGGAGRARFIRPAEDAYGLAPTDTSNTVAFGDLRGVRMPDAVNAGTNGALTYFENRGERDHADFALLSPEDDPIAFRATPAQSYDWRPVFVDIDGDGDLDLFVGTRDGTILFFENHGTARKPDFGVVTQVNPFGLRGAGQLVSLAFGDLDGDGDLDAIAANAAGELRYFENRGTARRPKFLLIPPGALGLTNASPEATVTLLDVDGDGDLDCITGGADGRLRYFENLRTPSQ